MSNKLVRLDGDQLLCTWIGADRCNQWVWVAPSGAVRARGPLGTPCADNHCGAALAATGGLVHAVVGAHHGRLLHYRFNPAVPDAGWMALGAVGDAATYPSLAADSEGNLHLAYRARGEPWALHYCRWEAARGRWIAPQSLILADKRGYVYWTNGLTVGADDAVHLVFGNTRQSADGSLYYGVSHLQTTDGGRHWRQDGGPLPALPAPAAALALLTGADDPDRLQAAADQARYSLPGPMNNNYRQMCLSNPVTDQHGRLHVIVHNGLTGTAHWYGRGKDGWRNHSLMGHASVAGKRRIHMQSALARSTGSDLRVALMVDDTECCTWGAPGTSLLLIDLAPESLTSRTVDRISAAAPEAAWLPALEQTMGWSGAPHTPALLYTHGVNAGGFSTNVNTVQTEVHLRR